MLIDKSPALKKAVLNMPSAEKDKLLLKLISKDLVLLNQLEFKLLENVSDLENRIDLIKNEIERKIKSINRYFSTHYSPGYFMMDVRELNGIINEHFTVTKDRISEIELRIYLLESVIKSDASMFFLKRTKQSEKLLAYFAARIKYILEKYEKLHEDLQFDFRDKLNKILSYAYQKAIKNDMILLQLPESI